MCRLIPEQCNFIAIGAWNTAIIQPDWLRSQFPDLIPESFHIQLVAEGTLRFDLEKIILDPNHGKLLFLPKKIDDETIDYIRELSVEIHKKLPHTPVKAAGCNFVFRLEEKECFTIAKMEDSKKLKIFYKDADLKDFSSKVINHTFSFQNYQLNIIYNFDKKTVQYNYDYHIGDPIETAAKSLKENFTHSMELNKKLIGNK